MTEEKNETELSKTFVEKIWPWAALAIVVVAAGAYYAYNQKSVSTLTLEQAKTKANEFINKNLMQGGATAAIKQVVEESGLYKISLNVNDQDYVSFMTRDGKTFFTTGIDIETVQKESAAAQSSQAPQNQDVPKTDKPNVELFVMSYCPYGTQAEKGILPAVALLGDKIDFKLKFVNYTMHGEKEMLENLRQYCVEKQEPRKFNNYLSCFLKAGDAAGCLASEKIDANKLAVCEQATDVQFKIKQSFQDKNSNNPPFLIFDADNKKYNVSGSPTLVINGTTVSGGRDPESFKKSICSAFASEPEACETVLSSVSPAPGFGEGAAANGAAGSCN
jgi:glutaredoxin